jgi:hypothetical protein
MAVNENIEVVLVRLNSLVMNEIAKKIYSTPKNYELIRQSIIDNGIIQPLLVNEEDNMIISGNLRYSIAKKLKMTYVPVVKVKIGEGQNINDLLILSNTQREKSLLDKYHENEYINGLFSYGQGARVDKKPELQKEKELKTQMRSVLSSAEIDYFGRINNLAKEKYGEENYRKKLIEGLKKIDGGEITRNAFFRFLKELEIDNIQEEIENLIKKGVIKSKGNKVKRVSENKIKPQIKFLNKEAAINEIQNILNKVSVKLHEEILQHFLSKSYKMTG